MNGTRAKRCENCQHWFSKSPGISLGDCKAPNDHRYSRVPVGDGSFAMMDSFGPEETRSDYICGAFSKRVKTDGAAQ